MFQLLKTKFSGSADLIDRNNDQTLEVVKEAVQRSPYLQHSLRISLMSALMEECPKVRRKAMGVFFRAGVNRFMKQMFDVESTT